MKTFLVLVCLVLATAAQAAPLPRQDDRVDLGEDINDTFVQEGLLWFPSKYAWGNSLSRCECIKNSTVSGKCITQRCWRIVLNSDGTVGKVFHYIGAE